jgi:RecA-family ATPase
MPKKLETMDAETLMTTPMEPLKFVVSGLIPEGLHVLAGSPKIGKSCLALWICLQVAKGEKVWGFETNKSEVLYLCLEDSFARIQSRLFEITDEASSTLHFAVMSDAIVSGLEHQIECFIKEHPDTGLIVIDTLQKVRKTVSANVNPYASDYDDINALKQIADRHHLAILLVHHLRKTGDADPLNMISGTSGIAGGADTNFVLQKDKLTENTATLICTGRDIEGREFTLLYDGNDDMTVESSPINLPSLPSSPSQDSNSAAVTPYSPLCGKIDGGVA